MCSTYTCDFRELEVKAEFLESAQWHFIGRVQKSNVSRLLKVKGLVMIETIDSIDTAAHVNQRCGVVMDVLVQVNITGEEQKNGCAPEQVPEVLHFIKSECKRLRLRGLMGIGKEGFPLLSELYSTYKEVYDMDVLSMGMSADYVEAIKYGANNLRLGSCIFGARI